jgi:transposase
MGMMQGMLSMRDLKAQDLQGLSPETVTALATQMLEHIELQTRELELKQKQIERKDRDIAWRDAKLEKVAFELARLKRWKFGAKSEAMTAEQRQMFQDTLLEDEADLAVRHCPITCAASSTVTSPRTPLARLRTAGSR